MTTRQTMKTSSMKQSPSASLEMASEEYELSSVDSNEDLRSDCKPKSTTTSSRNLPPRVLKLPSSSFRYLSRRHLERDDVEIPDFDETESSDVHSFASDEEEYEKIEVADGVFMRLRGSQETQECWNRGECIQTTCFVCDIQLACVRDCDCVICPQCRLVSPVDIMPQTAAFGMPRVGGVGLGIML